MVWREAIDKAAAYLDGKGVPCARGAAEFLVARLAGLGRGMLGGFASEECDERRLEAMRRGMKRLAAGEPLQYVLGEWDFRRLTLKCDRRALIPRPETEGLVDRALAFLATRAARCGSRPSVVDAGTGTGAIILSIAKEYRGDALLVGTDASEDAIALARENAVLCSLEEKAAFAVMDGLDGFDEPGSIDLVVSNPPYIESGAIAGLDPRVRDWEPRMALDGGADGLAFYERYLGDALNLLKPGGAALFEIGDTQGEAVAAMFKAYGFAEIKIEKDLAGRDRYAGGRLLQ